MEASTEIAVTCEVDAPSAIAFWKRIRSSCHWAVLPGAETTGMMRSCCQSSVMARRTADSDTSRPSACFNCGNGGVAGFKQLVGLDGQRRYLARSGQLRAAPPVAVAAQSVDVGQYPCRHNEVGLLAGLSEHVQPDCHAIRFQANEQFFCRATVLAAGV